MRERQGKYLALDTTLKDDVFRSATDQDRKTANKLRRMYYHRTYLEGDLSIRKKARAQFNRAATFVIRFRKQGLYVAVTPKGEVVALLKLRRLMFRHSEYKIVTRVCHPDHEGGDGQRGASGRLKAYYMSQMPPGQKLVSTAATELRKRKYKNVGATPIQGRREWGIVGKQFLAWYPEQYYGPDGTAHPDSPRPQTHTIPPADHS